MTGVGKSACFLQGIEKRMKLVFKNSHIAFFPDRGDRAQRGIGRPNVFDICDCGACGARRQGRFDQVQACATVANQREIHEMVTVVSLLSTFFP